jgi:hypothetical protein
LAQEKEIGVGLVELSWTLVNIKKNVFLIRQIGAIFD